MNSHQALIACVRGLQVGCAPLLLRLVSEPPMHTVTSEPPMHAGAADRFVRSVTTSPLTKLHACPLTKLPACPLTKLHACPLTKLPAGPLTKLPAGPLTKLHASVSARLVAIEALGAHGAEPLYAPAAVAQLAAVVASTCGEDGGARAVAARALAQLSARSIGGTRALAVAVGAAVGVLSVAVQLDPDRYVRGFASEALANVAVLAFVHAQSPSGEVPSPTELATVHAQSPSGEVPSPAELEALTDTSWRAAEALRASGLAVEVDHMLHQLLGQMLHTCASARGMRNGGARDDAMIDLAHDAVRWLCCRRRCPITTPENPF